MKDVLQDKRAYIDMARKMADLYEEILEKYSFFRVAVHKIFESHQGYHFISSESIFKGFFFLFVYKDFVLRDMIARIKEFLPNDRLLRVLDQIEADY